MGIGSPTTYGENYWALQVEAEKTFYDDVEQEVSGYVEAMFQSLGVRDVLPPAVGRFVDSMTAKGSFAWGAILGRFGSEMADSILGQTMSSALQDFNYMMAEKFHDLRLTPDQANLLYQRKSISDDFWAARMLSGGYAPSEAIHAYGASLPYPSISDIMLYTRYHDEGRISRSDVWELFDVPADEFPLWEWLTMQRITTADAHTMLRRGLFTESDYLKELSKIGWATDDQVRLKEIGWLMPNAMLLAQGDLMQELSTDRIIEDISIADINPQYARNYLDAILTKPASTDIIAYELRKDPDLSELDHRLRRIGIHPDYFSLYKELAHPIPPVADIITMAVREAFTPAIAAKFGQYEDLPPEYVNWVQRKGLSREWAERYWAAHWSLPSPMQGFEMLHRGAIDFGELDMLLRALDVMPFWRDKLTKIAYRRLTRVDIRRMYKAGVLTETEVYESYVQHGYTEINARRMTEFTVQWAAPKEASITRSDILTAYKNRMIARAEASELLADMGEEYFHREFMLKAVDYKKGLELTENKIKGIRNLYRQRIYDENKTLEELLKLDLPSEEVEDLMAQWYYEVKAEVPKLWTSAQVLSFVKKNLITKERGIIELSIIGYDTEHIDVYMRSIE